MRDSRGGEEGCRGEMKLLADMWRIGERQYYEVAPWRVVLGEYWSCRLGVEVACGSTARCLHRSRTQGLLP